MSNNTSANTVIEAQGLSVYRGKTPVLSDINFSVSAGEVFALLGGNGAGKSTTLLTFLAFLEPTAGQARIFGQSVQANVAAIRRRVAYLPEAARLYEHLSAYENLDYFLSLAGLTRSRAELDQALDQVSLQPAARSQRMAHYSKGMRQKVAIALALLREADVLLLDEPTSGLDPVAIDEFHQLVHRVSEAGKTTLMVTHDVYGACQVADRIGLLRQGQLVDQFATSGDTRIETEAVHKAFCAGEAL